MHTAHQQYDWYFSSLSQEEDERERERQNRLRQGMKKKRIKQETKNTILTPVAV